MEKIDESTFKVNNKEYLPIITETVDEFVLQNENQVKNVKVILFYNLFRKIARENFNKVKTMLEDDIDLIKYKNSEVYKNKYTGEKFSLNDIEPYLSQNKINEVVLTKMEFYLTRQTIRRDKTVSIILTEPSFGKTRSLENASNRIINRRYNLILNRMKHPQRLSFYESFLYYTVDSVINIIEEANPYLKNLE